MYVLCAVEWSFRAISYCFVHRRTSRFGSRFGSKRIFKNMVELFGQKSARKSSEIKRFRSFLWQAAPFKITMISPVFSRVSAIFGNPFPSWRGVLLDGHCATQKDIAYSKQPSPYTLIAIVYLCSPNGISTKLLTLPSRIWS